MPKKNLAVLSLAYGALLMLTSNVLAIFDPGSTPFSQIETLKTWVKNDFYNNPVIIEEIQKLAAMAVPQNPFSKIYVGPIFNDPGVTQNFGHTYPTIAAIQLPFLQFVHLVSLGKDPIVFEVGAGSGFVSLLVPYAFERSGIHYVNDLSSTMLDQCFRLFNHWVRSDLLHCFNRLPSSCFEILYNNPELRESVDAFYAQNVEHFFNPVQHYMFLALLEELLRPGGLAFLCAETLAFDDKGALLDNPLHNLFTREKNKGGIYPAFSHQVVVSRILEVEGYPVELLGYRRILSAYRPDDTTATGTKILKEEHLDAMDYSQYDLTLHHEKAKEMTLSKIFNPMSPWTYIEAVKLHPKLELVDTFCIDAKGVRQDKCDSKSKFAAAIIRKKIESQSPSSTNHQGEKIRIEKMVSRTLCELSIVGI